MQVRRVSDEPLIHLVPPAARGEPPIRTRGREQRLTATTCSRGRQQCSGMTGPDAPR
jgi:hypothetical protein